MNLTLEMTKNIMVTRKQLIYSDIIAFLALSKKKSVLVLLKPQGVQYCRNVSSNVKTVEVNNTLR